MLVVMNSRVRSSRRLIAASTLLFSVLVLLPPARATVARALSLSQLVNSSSDVVVGTTLTSESKWESLGGQKRIVTYSDLRVDDSVVGKAKTGEKLRILTLGGRVGDIGQAVLGAAKLRKGEQALMFLSKSDTTRRVVGMSQGQFLVRRGEDGKRRVELGAQRAHLLGASSSAAHLLQGIELSRAVELVRAAKGKIDED